MVGDSAAWDAGGAELDAALGVGGVDAEGAVAPPPLAHEQHVGRRGAVGPQPGDGAVGSDGAHVAHEPAVGPERDQAPLLLAAGLGAERVAQAPGGHSDAARWQARQRQWFQWWQVLQLYVPAAKPGPILLKLPG